MIHADCKLGHGRHHVRLAFEVYYWLYRALLQRLRVYGGPQLERSVNAWRGSGFPGWGHGSNHLLMLY